MRRVLRVPVETGDTEPEHELVQLLQSFLLIMNTSSGYSIDEGGWVFKVGWRWQITEKGAKGPS